MTDQKPIKNISGAGTTPFRYFSKVNGQVNAEVEDYVKQRLIDCQFKFRLDEPPDKP